MSSSQVESISEKIKKHFMKKTGKSISSMQPKMSSEQAGCSKEEKYERLMMEMKILFQEKYEEVDSLSDDIKKQKMLQEELRGEVEEKARELSQVQKEFRGYQDKFTALSLVLQSQMTSFEDVFSQKSEMEKVLDITLKESQVMKSKIRDLELNSASILEKNLKLTKEIEKLTAEKTEMKSRERLKSLLDNFPLRETISTLQKENEELQSKVAEVGKSYEEALEMMQRKLDLVIKEKEEMNERYLASNEEIEELRKEMNSLRVAGSSEFQDAKLKAEEEDEILEGVLRMSENLETLYSENEKLKKENEKLKKEYDSALNGLKNNVVTLKVVDRYRVELEQELKTRYQENVELRKELKSLSASF